MAARVREVVWAESARDALDEITTYIAQDSREAAVRGLTAALESAASLSGRGRMVPALANPVIREIFVFRYRLMYRVEDERIVVLAFVHGARDFATWRQEQDAR
jgi:toxin ParE1/3/4